MATFRRLLGFLRPYRTGVIWSFVLAGLAMGMGVLIPYLVGRTVDEIRNGRVNLWPLAGAILAAAGLRLALSAARRLVAGRVSLGVEFDLRNRVYGHLQELELGFFDEQQTGQLISRANSDIRSVQMLLAFAPYVFVDLVRALAHGAPHGVAPRGSMTGGGLLQVVGALALLAPIAYLILLVRKRLTMSPKDKESEWKHLRSSGKRPVERERHSDHAPSLFDDDEKES